MDIIHTNPYRIAGILSNAIARELQKQKGKIKAFAKVGKEITSELDFDFLNSIERTEQNIGKAFSNIEQNQDKVNNSLFWFLNANPSDEQAISHLKDGNREKALETWGGMTDNKEVKSNTFSAFNNIGTLKLLSKSEFEIKEGIEAKIKLIESEYFENFVHIVADQTFTIDNKKQTEKFIDELLTQFKNKYSSADALDLFNNCNGSTRQYVSQKFTEEPIHNIEIKIEATKHKRKEEPDNAYNFGVKLVNQTKEDIALLKQSLGIDNLQYQLLADGLAKEIMQCGIDYFQYFRDSIDPSDEVLKLLGYARKIVVGTQTIERIDGNLEGINEWIQTHAIQQDINLVTVKLETFENQKNTIPNAEKLIMDCKPSLEKIEIELGSTDQFNVQISSAVVNNALSAIIEVVNEKQGELQYDQSKIIALPAIISSALKVINSIGNLAMNPELKRRYKENKNIILDISSQLIATERHQNSGFKIYHNPSSNSSSSGCYIATMAYGNYNHSQVLELRKFRDEYLSESLLGRWFIRTYYNYSPSLVEKLKDKKKSIISSAKP